MKKFLLPFAAFAAVVACNDNLSVDQPEGPASKNGTVILDAGFDFSEEEETKLSNPWGDYISYPYAVWDEGDNFKLVTYADSIYKSAAYPKGNFKFTDCGAFTLTSGAGKSTGKFIGTIPEEAASDTNGLAFFPSENFVEFYFNKNEGKPVYGVCKFSAPTVQDGSGFKYMSAISKFMNGKLQGFKFVTVLWHMWVPSGAQVDSVVVDATPSKVNIVGDNLTVYYKDDDGKVTSATNSGGSSKKVTICNPGEKLSGNVFFVTRNTTAEFDGAKLKFYKGAVLIKTVSFKMPKASTGKLYSLGCPLVGGYDYTAVWSQKLPFASAHSEQYAEFPYSGNKVTGKGYPIYDITRPGASATSEDTTLALGFSDSKLAELVAEREYTFKSATEDSTVYTVTFGGNNYFLASWVKTSAIRMDAGAYLTTPVVSGKKLVGIKMTPYNAYTATLRFKVTSDAAGENVLDGGEAKALYKLAKNKEYPIGTLSSDVFADQFWWLYGTEVGKPYYLMSNAGSSQTTKITFLYK